MRIISFNVPKSMLKLVTLCLAIFLINLYSCSEKAELGDNVINNKISNIIIFVYPPHEAGSFNSLNYFAREVYVYDNKTDFLNQVNPISYGLYAWRELNVNPNKIKLSDINSTNLYIRTTLWQIWRSYDLKINLGNFIYKDSITIPDFYCDTNIYLNNDKWEEVH